MRTLVSSKELFFEDESNDINFDKELDLLEETLPEEVTSNSFGITMPEHIVDITRPTPRKFPKVNVLDYCFGSGAGQVKWMTCQAMKGNYSWKKRPKKEKITH